jgi:F0F1-type ATP synthase membrane subunit b/b'
MRAAHCLPGSVNVLIQNKRTTMNLTAKCTLALAAACLTIGLCSVTARADDKDNLKHSTAHLNRSLKKASKSANRDLNRASKSANRDVNRASKSTNRNAKRNSKRINHNVPKEAKRESKDVNHTAQGDPDNTKGKK